MSTESAAATNKEIEIGEMYAGVCAHWVDKGHGYGFIRVAGIERDTRPDECRSSAA